MRQILRLCPDLLRLLAAAVLCLVALPPAQAAQRSGPAWWDPDGVGTGTDWHYRVAVTLPAGTSVQSTARIDIDFAALMVQLGISGTFDPASVRVVRPGGTLATVQEYTPTIYAGATNATPARGEVRWLVEDGGAQTWQVYFDVTANGTKPANPQTPINGNFEHSASGTLLPAGWASAVKSSAVYDMQVRPAETVSVTTDGTNAGNNPYSTDGTPLTGSNSYLIGARTNNEPTSSAGLQANATVLTRTIVVPATNPGSLTLNWRTEGWDSEGFDYLTVTLTGPGGTVTVIDPALGNYSAAPTSPNSGTSAVSTSTAGYGHYNGYDTTSSGTHTAGMTVAQRSERWWSRSQSLSAFAGQTVTLTIATSHTEQFRSWFHIDDVAWSVVAGTLGAAQGFGAAITAPAGSVAPGQSVRVVATVDAKPTGAGNPVLADLLYPNGTVLIGGIVLYNDGAHGDGAAGDAVWGSDATTLALGTPSSAGWQVRLTARDASTSTQGASYNGLAHQNGQGAAITPANWWNVDLTTFSIDNAVLEVTKLMTVLADGINSTDPKAIPGATLRYCLQIANSGTAAAGNVTATDALPANVSYLPGTLASGADCTATPTPEDDDATGADETDPTGAGIVGSTITVTRPSLAPGASMAVSFQVTVN